MKIVVVGGTGLIGAKLVQKLRLHGHDAIAASPSRGVDTFTGVGLTQVMMAAAVVIDVSNAPSFEDASVLEFFETSTSRILAAGAVAQVKHHVILSVAGAGRLPGSGYMRAKVAQEKLVQASTQPFTIVRATQFFEFLLGIANANTRGNKVYLPPALVQPLAAADVADALADVALGPPADDTVELAGPERFQLDELIRHYLGAIHDSREVVSEPSARYFGALLAERSLLPGDNPRIASTHFEQWLDRARLR